MKHTALRASAAAFILLMAFVAGAMASPLRTEPSGDAALAIYRSAIRQAEATVAVLSDNKVDRTSADQAFERAFQSAVWEGIVLTMPSVSPEQRGQIATFIQSGRGFAVESASATLADYLLAGKAVDKAAQFAIDRDADEAFKFGYSQAVARARREAP